MSDLMSNKSKETITSSSKGLAGVEKIKIESDFLRGTLKTSLANPVTGAVANDDQMVIKFHGVYQQDDRDLRLERKKQMLEPLHSFMIRARVPGGVASAKQYLQMANIAETYSSGSLRLTTRQAFQWHGVFKRNLKKTIASINQSLLDTIAACGDVNRNVMANPLPETSHVHNEVYEWSKKISEHLLPSTRAYHEIWLDNERIIGKENEPIYGDTYLPRKFKTAIAVPPYNDVDVYTNDLGFIAVVENQKLVGFNVVAGGGMGSNHGDFDTYPQLAKAIGFCQLEQVLSVAENVVKVQRDHGNREQRKLARLKYTLDKMGLEKFKETLFDYLGYSLPESRPIDFIHNGDRYGWLQDENDLWHVTLYIHSGRIVDSQTSQLFTGLKSIAEIHDGEFRITPNQNLIISKIPQEKKQLVEALLDQHQISFGNNESKTRKNSLACVAFPTCSLAMAEAERYLPTFLDKIDALQEKYQLTAIPINIRMTGCPNGCARPFVAEIGLVGKAPGKYNLYLGGTTTGERLNQLYRENIGEQEILGVIEPLFESFSKLRQGSECFGDYLVRNNMVRPIDDGKKFHREVA